MRCDCLGNIWQVTFLNVNSSSPYNRLKKIIILSIVPLPVWQLKGNLHADMPLYVSHFGGRGFSQTRIIITKANIYLLITQSVLDIFLSAFHALIYLILLTTL